MKTIRNTALLAILLALAAACGRGDPRDTAVRDGVAQVRRTLDDINRNLAARLSYESIIEMGGTPLTYVAANMPDGSDLPPCIWEGRAEPWSIVIREGSAPGEFLVEGYGAGTDKPMLVESVTVGPMPQI